MPDVMTPDHARPLLSLTGISKIYDPRAGAPLTALRDVTLDVQRNEFVTLVGPSGCGKSTLLKLIGGIEAPSAGDIVFDGRRLTEPSPRAGLVFQRPILLPWRNVLGNILFPIEMLGWPTRSFRDEAVRLIELVGLKGFERSLPHELSGGMQQRVAICRALIYDPQLLLMDEPFGALDAMTREELSIELLRIWTERRKTIVFVTHSISEAVLLGDRVIVMTARPGRIVEDLRVEIARPRSLDAEGTPEFTALVRRVRAAIYASRKVST
jgi:NitT/TauT family transport system ATP-binding protein